MSDEELDSHYKKLQEEDESKFLGSDERLAYYRSHGLTNCSDYPGGDAAFVRDVLSGDQREEHRPFTFDMKQEDAYISAGVLSVGVLRSIWISECIFVCIQRL